MNSEQHGDSEGPEPTGPQAIPAWLHLVRKQVESLKFGTVQITVHDSRVTEVVKAEKTRLEPVRQAGRSQTTGPA